MSRTRHHRSKKNRNHGSDAKRLGNKHWNGCPGPEQKKITMHMERMAAKSELREELRIA